MRGILVDDPKRDSVPSAFGGERQPDGAGANDQYWGIIHRFSLFESCLCGVAAPQDNLCHVISHAERPMEDIFGIIAHRLKRSFQGAKILSASESSYSRPPAQNCLSGRCK